MWQLTTAGQIADLLGAELLGADTRLARPTALWDADSDSLCFLTEKPAADFDFSKPPGLTIALPEVVSMLRDANYPVIAHDAPKFAFCKAVHTLMRPPSIGGVHETAILSPEVTLGANVSIGPFCVLEGQIELGDGVVLESAVNLYNSVMVGAETTIRSGARIGYDPFSFGQSASGEAYPFPAYGSVRIGSFVDIYHNVSIARGTAADTVIADWVRIGNHAHIGNAVEIEMGTTICAQTDISAQVRIGPGCWIAQSAAIRQKVLIGAETTVGMGAVVVENVPARVTVTGVPARVRGEMAS